MEGLGDRLRARARDLGLADAEVARRADLAQTRYANYVADRHEPDLATLLRICSVLGASASEILGQILSVSDEVTCLRSKVNTAMAALDSNALSVLATVADALVARGSPTAHVDPVETKTTNRRITLQK